MCRRRSRRSVSGTRAPSCASSRAVRGADAVTDRHVFYDTVVLFEHMKTGVFVPPNDPGAIEAAISVLVGNEGLRSRLGQAARDRVKQIYFPRHYANEVSNVLQ